MDNTTLSWKEIKDRALKFSYEWTGTSSEKQEAQEFVARFFDVFGISRKRVGIFEKPVKKLDDVQNGLPLSNT